MTLETSHRSTLALRAILRATAAAFAPALLLAQDGDLRNQTWLPTVDRAGRERLATVLEALDRGTSAAEIRAASRAFLEGGDPGELLSVDERVLVSKRRALLQAWIDRMDGRRDLLGGVPPAHPAAALDPTAPGTLAALEDAATDHPGSLRAVRLLRRLGDAHLAAGRPLEAAVLYRRAATHELGRADAGSDAGLRVRRFLAACRLEPHHRLVEIGRGLPEEPVLIAGQPVDGAALLEDHAPPPPGPDDPSARLALRWSEPLDEDPGHVPLSTYGIRREDPPHGESDLQPAPVGAWIYVQDRLRLYRFERATGRRAEVLVLEEVLTPESGGAWAARAPYRGWVRRRPAAGDGHVVCVHGDGNHEAERRVVAGFAVPRAAGEATALRWTRSGVRWTRFDAAGGAPREELDPQGGERVFGAFPTVVQDRVYVVSRPARDLRQRLELWCLDLATGQRLFRVVLCEGTPVLGDAGLGSLRTGGPLPLAAPLYHDGTLWVGTPLGVQFAVDPLDGEVLLAVRTARSAEPGMRFESTDLHVAGADVVFGPPDADHLYGLRPPETVRRPDGTSVFAFPPLERGALVAHLGSRDHEHFFVLREPRWRSLVQLRMDPASGGLAWSVAGDAGSQDERASSWPWIQGDALFLCTDQSLYTFDLTREFFATHRARRPLEPGSSIPLPPGRCFGNLSGLDGGLLAVGALGVSFWEPRR